MTKNTWSAPNARAAVLLRLLDVAGRLEQAVEAAGGGAALGQEQVHAVELAHVADPVGLEDRLAARDRQRVERADRTLRVFLQIVEERRLVARLHALEDRKMQLEQLLHRIEHPAHRLRLRASGDLLDLPARHHIEIELRPDPLDHLRQLQGARVGALLVHRARDQRSQDRRIMPRPEWKTVLDDHRREVRIEHGRTEGVLEAPDEDRLVDERVQRTAQAAPFGGERGPSGRGRAGDDQDLEVGTMCIRAPERRRQHVRGHGVLVLVLRPLAGILAVPAGQQRAQDAAGELRDRARVALVVAQRGEQLRTRIGMERLGDGQLAERGVELRPVTGPSPRLRPIPRGGATGRPCAPGPAKNRSIWMAWPSAP